ncbi:MAG: mechanosensitive ion channel family protein [Bacteroidia bacterium]|nr:mechanosensitive ion channel family protein [Bacteroidia bacterium]
MIQPTVSPVRDPEIRPTWMAYGLFVLKLIALIVLIGLQTSNEDLLLSIGIPDRYLQALVFFLTGQIVLSFARTTLAALYRRKRKRQGKTKAGGNDNFILGINQISAIASFIIFILAALIIFNIDLKEALTAISIVAAAIAILSKDYVSNMINGMILMFSDNVNLDDYVKIGDEEGKIVDITLLHVHLINDDDNIVLIPNSLILTDGITNYSRRDKRLVSIDFDLAVAQMDSVEEVASRLRDPLGKYSEYLVPDSIKIRATELRKDSVQFKFQCVLNDKGTKEITNKVRNAMIKAAITLSTGQPVSLKTT